MLSDDNKALPPTADNDNGPLLVLIIPEPDVAVNDTPPPAVTDTIPDGAFTSTFPFVDCNVTPVLPDIETKLFDDDNDADPPEAVIVIGAFAVIEPVPAPDERTVNPDTAVNDATVAALTIILPDGADILVLVAPDTVAVSVDETTALPPVAVNDAGPFCAVRVTEPVEVDDTPTPLLPVNDIIPVVDVTARGPVVAVTDTPVPPLTVAVVDDNNCT